MRLWRHGMRTLNTIWRSPRTSLRIYCHVLSLFWVSLLNVSICWHCFSAKVISQDRIRSGIIFQNGSFCLGQDNNLDSIPRMKLKETEPMLYTMLEFNREYEIFSKKLQESTSRIQNEVVNKILESPFDHMKRLSNNCKHKSIMKKTLIKRSSRTMDKLKKFLKVWMTVVRIDVYVRIFLTLALISTKVSKVWTPLRILDCC